MLSRAATWYKENIDRAQANHAAWRTANPQKHRANSIAWANANPDSRHKIQAKWRNNNVEKARASVTAWAKANPEKIRAKNHKRRAIKQNAIPSWFGEFDNFVLEEAAKLCKLRGQTTGIKYHIDHVVPLISPLVCGLHCAANIQVISASDNLSKQNRFWPDMWQEKRIVL